MASLALPAATPTPERRRISPGQAAAAERAARFVAAHRVSGNGGANGTSRVTPRVGPGVASRRQPQPRPRPSSAVRAAPAPRPRSHPTSRGPARIRGDDLALGAALG